jgi:hypothetical protein
MPAASRVLSPSPESMTALESISIAGALPLARIRRSTHYIWEADKHNEFMNWRLPTKRGIAQNVCGNPWWNSKKRRTASWSSFDQCAHVQTEEPGLCCKACFGVFVHPHSHNNGDSNPARNIKFGCPATH